MACGTYLIALFLPANAPFSRAESYRVVPASSDLFAFDYLQLNDAGLVAFKAQRPNAGGVRDTIGFYKGRAGSLTPLLEVAGTAPSSAFFGSSLTMSPAGLVAISGTLARQTVTLIGRGSLDVNRSSLVVGSATSLSDVGYLIGDQGVQDVNARYPGCLSCRGVMNNRLRVLATSSSRIIVYTIGFTNDPASGPTPFPERTNVVATTVSPALAFKTMVINDAGAVAFADEASNGKIGIYLWSGSGTPRAVVDPTTSSEFLFDNGGPALALNELNEVAFLARSARLSARGIFKGPNAVLDKIIIEGDRVAGQTVGGIRIPDGVNHRWFNSAGQAVFVGRAAGETRESVWLTDAVASTPAPAPPPTAFRWEGTSAPPNGSFSDVANWKPESGTEARVPESTSVQRDIAIFDRPEVYTVDVGTRHNERLLVKNGNVIFEAGGYVLDALSQEEPSVLIDNARLQLLTAMSLTNNHALIGSSAAARVDVGFGGNWKTHGSLRVGGPGNGILNIDAGGKVDSTEIRVGTGQGGGSLIVNDDGSLSVHKIAVGSGGKGELTVQPDGLFSCFALIIGEQPGIGSRATIKGGVQAEYLGVGDAGTGRLEIRDGAFVLALQASMADNSAASGSVLVTGAGSQLIDGDQGALSIGTYGAGELIVEDGGRVGFKTISVGYEGFGTLQVRGFHESAGRSHVYAGSISFGSYSGGAGEIEIVNGALVECNDAAVTAGTLMYGPSQVRILGGNSLWSVTNTLTIGDSGAIEAQANGIVTLFAGTLQVGTLRLEAGGVLQGVGVVNASDRVINENGTISPGLSPGTLTIRGDFEQRAGGRLLMEIGGTNAADYDHLAITNQALLDGQLTFRFVKGYAPKAGDRFDVLNVGGGISGAFANLGVQNLAPGFEFNIETDGPLLHMTALNDGVFSAALPGQVSITITNVGGLTYALYSIETASTCDTIVLDGAFTRTNNTFTQVFRGTRLARGDCQQFPQTESGALLLGALAPGDYVLAVSSGEAVVQTIPFSVPAGAKETLLRPTRLSDGSLQFELEGLPPFGYTVEASEDMQAWTKLERGTLPGTFIDPEAAILPRRFYRASVAR